MAYGDEDDRNIVGGFSDTSKVGYADMQTQYDAGVNILDTPLTASEKLTQHRIAQIYGGSQIDTSTTSGGGDGIAVIFVAIIACGVVAWFPLSILYALKEHVSRKQWIMAGIVPLLLAMYVIVYPSNTGVSFEPILILNAIFSGIYLTLLAGGYGAAWLLKRSSLPFPTLWSRVVPVVLLLPLLPLSMTLLGQVVPNAYREPPLLAAASGVLLCIPGFLMMQRFRRRMSRKKRPVPLLLSVLATVVALPILLLAVSFLLEKFDHRWNLVHLLIDWLQS